MKVSTGCPERCLPASSLDNLRIERLRFSNVYSSTFFCGGRCKPLPVRHLCAHRLFTC